MSSLNNIHHHQHQQQQDIQHTTTTIQNILLTHKKYNYKNKLTDLENTTESIELLKLERKLSRNLLAILRYMFNNEFIRQQDKEESTHSNSNSSSIITNKKPKLSDLKRKYGFLFSTVLRASIEEIYRLGGSYGIKFDELPSLTYFTTESDLVLIRQYTTQYSQRIWFRIDKFMLNRVPDATPLKGSFIVNTLAAEIATYVMMEATKEKTRQVLSILDPNNNNYSNSTMATESAATASINPVLGYGPESISALLAIKGFSEIKEKSDFSSILEYSEDQAFFTNVMNDRYFFMWQTARDDRVCKKYCRPLDGVLWTLKEINYIPDPDQLTHPFCRCRLIKIRI